MAQTVVGLFDNWDDAEAAISDLTENGYDPKQVSIVVEDRGQTKTMAADQDRSATSGTISGMATGAVVGGLAGLLASFVLPGLGAFLVGGPIAAALGLTGMAASTVSGMATGAVAGGLIGALTDLGLTEEEATHYRDRVKEGAILMATSVDENEVAEVQAIFNVNNAQDVRTAAVGGRRAEIVEEDVEEVPLQRRPEYAYMGAKGGKSKRDTKKTTKSSSKKSTRTKQKK